MENNVVSVMLWGEEVGKLYWDERSKRAVFNYHPDFIKKGVEIAPLTASVKGSTAKGMPILGNREKIYQGVRTETLRKNIKDKRYGLAYAIEELQIEHLQRSVSENALIQQSSPMNVWLSIIHYSLFALAGYACYSFVKEMNVSWYMLIMALIAFILIYVLSKINVTKIWIIKNLIYEKIGIQ